MRHRAASISQRLCKLAKPLNVCGGPCKIRTCDQRIKSARKRLFINNLGSPSLAYAREVSAALSRSRDLGICYSEIHGAST